MDNNTHIKKKLVNILRNNKNEIKVTNNYDYGSMKKTKLSYRYRFKFRILIETH